MLRQQVLDVEEDTVIELQGYVAEGGSVTASRLDLSDFDTVKEFAKMYKVRHDVDDGMILIIGILMLSQILL